jgi:hypothetical protein
MKLCCDGLGRGRRLDDAVISGGVALGVLSWWQYGAKQESAEDAAMKRMSVEHFRELRGQLDEWGVL